MIKITITSGEWAGRTRYFLGDRVVESFDPHKFGEPVKPGELFNGFLNHGDTWEVDYSQATPEEVLQWFVPEIAARIFRALEAGRIVKFMGHEWCWKADGPSLITLAGEIEDKIADSGFNITLESDDEAGVVIGTRGLEH